jgi:hypothetical protein
MAIGKGIQRFGIGMSNERSAAEGAIAPQEPARIFQMVDDFKRTDRVSSTSNDGVERVVQVALMALHTRRSPFLQSSSNATTSNPHRANEA